MRVIKLEDDEYSMLVETLLSMANESRIKGQSGKQTHETFKGLCENVIEAEVLDQAAIDG